MKHSSFIAQNKQWQKANECKTLQLISPGKEWQKKLTDNFAARLEEIGFQPLTLDPGKRKIANQPNLIKTEVKFLVVCEWQMNDLGMSCEWDNYEIFVEFLDVCDHARQGLWMRWAWALRDNNLHSRPTKNSSWKFVRNWGKDRNELEIDLSI